MSPSGNREKWQNRFSELKKKLLRRDVAVFSFFLLLSFIFWFLNGLSKEMNGRIDYPVRYINFPEDRALVNELPDKLEIYLKGPGYSIVQAKLDGRREHLDIDLDKASIRILENEDRLRFYLLSYNTKELLSSQIRSDFSIISVSPDTIIFEFDRISKRMVPVVANIEVVPLRQFFVHGEIVCIPDSIEISGPKTIVDTIKSIYTRSYTFDQINETETKTLSLESVKKISLSERRVEVTVPVEQFTEAVLELPVSILNVPDTAKLRLFPDKVSVKCIVALSDYNSLMDSPVEAAVDMEDIDVMTTNRLKIFLRNMPDYVSQVAFNPQFVEYLIEKK